MAFFQNIAQFSTCKNPEISTKLQMSKLGKTFSISKVFNYSTFGQDVLHYIHPENLRME